MDWKTLVVDDILKIEKTIAADLLELEARMDPKLTEILRYSMMGGGKKVRPLLVILAARMCGNTDDAVYRLAVAFEYLHVATLIHDDVIDNADYRRGKESVVKKFGMVEAILVGDFLHAYAINLVGEITGNKGLAIFTDATCGMVDGEFIQLRNCDQFSLSEESYFEAITGKTVKLITAACEVGAIYGGGSEVEQGLLRKYGENLGGAFQIVDDLLDYQGDSAVTGKAVGNDLLEGKVTLPLILARKNMQEQDEARFITMLADKAGREKLLPEITAMVEKHNGFQLSREKAQEMISHAQDAVQPFKESDEHAVAVFSGLANYVLERKK